MTDVFLSYSREDQPTARRFAEALQREGFSVWWDQSLSAGEAFDRVTEKALDEAKAVVVLWSKRSVQSDWVRAEATQARANHRLVPVMIEACKRPIMFELTHTADLSNWKGDANDPAWRAYVADVRRFVHKGETGTAQLPVATREAPRSPARTKFVWGAAIVVLAVAAGLAWHFHGRQPAGATTRSEASVAVLPFRDMSPNKDQEYWADGVTEEILNVLASIPELRVTARTSSFAFKDKDVSLREVGQTLGVAYILEGSIRKDGDQLRITAQLIDTGTDAHLWSRTYNRPLQEVFKVQEEIANNVATTLAVSLGVGKRAQLPGFTRNVDAFDAFLQGQKAVETVNAQSTLRAIELYKSAVALDPAFALAWSRLENAYLQAANVLPDPPGKPWTQLAAEASQEARRLAPDGFYVLFSDAQRSMREGKWNNVARLYDQLEAESSQQGMPVNVDSARNLFTLIVGRAREAIVLQERLRSRNPLASGVAFVLADAYADAGDLKAALDEMDRGQKLENPTVQLWGIALLTAMATGDRKQVDARLDAVISRRTDGLPVYAAMKPLLDNPAKALAELRQLYAHSPGPQANSTIAAWAAWFGDPEFALEILRAQAPRGAPTDILRYWRPVMKDVRKLPGFKDLVNDLGLVEYWRTNVWGDFCKPTTGDDFECN